MSNTNNEELSVKVASMWKDIKANDNNKIDTIWPTLLVIAGLYYIADGFYINMEARAITDQLYANGVQIKGLVLIAIAVLMHMLPPYANKE